MNQSVRASSIWFVASSLSVLPNWESTAIADVGKVAHTSLMVSRSQLTLALAGAVFLSGCAYVGYVNELLKDTIPPLHRAILMIEFILGAGAASRWIMVLDIKRNMAKIKRIRSNRKSAHNTRR